MKLKSKTRILRQKKNLIFTRISDKFQIFFPEYKKWSLLTKFDCYSKIFQTKNICAQLFWTAIFLIFTASTAYFVAANVLSFLEFEVITKIRIINEKPTIFPTVTICDANPFTALYTQQLMNKIILTEYGTDIYNLSNYDASMNFTDIFELAKMYTSSNLFSSTKKKLLGTFHTLGIKNCVFNELECSPSDFIWFFKYEYGKNVTIFFQYL